MSTEYKVGQKWETLHYGVGEITAIFENSSLVELKFGIGETAIFHFSALQRQITVETSEERLERALVLAEHSESTDAILIAEEVRRLRRMVEKVDVMVQRPQVSRVELIVNSQREKVIYGATGVSTALQDGGQTLKVFLTKDHQETELEYAIQYHDDKENKWKITDRYHGGDGPEYWGELEERERVLDDLRTDYPNITFLMVKRQKAGKVWYA